MVRERAVYLLGELMQVVGFLLVMAGVTLLSVPAAMIVGGLALFGIGFALTVGKPRPPKAPE